MKQRRQVWNSPGYRIMEHSDGPRRFELRMGGKSIRFYKHESSAHRAANRILEKAHEGDA